MKYFFSAMLMAAMLCCMAACANNMDSDGNRSEDVGTSQVENEIQENESQDNETQKNEIQEKEIQENDGASTGEEVTEPLAPPVELQEGEVCIVVKKEDRLLELWQGDNLVDSFPIGLGWNPKGHKQVEGDGKTPEGEYYVCLKNYDSAFYLSLGVSYPNKEDAAAALHDGRINQDTYEEIAQAIERGQRPDWYTALGGEIMIHGHGSSSDWTAGCIAVENEVMDFLFEYCQVGTRIIILP